MPEKFYLTTAIDYVNSSPHLGTAYEKIAADCLVRAHRRLGCDVRFVMGNDEHSTNVEKAAKAAGLTPREYTDRMEGVFRDAWERLDISYDDFIRTSEPRHHAAVREIVRRVREAGWLRKDKYSGWYCEGCEAFYTEKDLVDGLCPNHRTKPRWVEEENWFFALSRFQGPLLEHIRANPGFIRPPARRNEIVSFLESGLSDISVSRAGVTWGIAFPDDPDHVVYVWFDALTNYLSATGFGTDDAASARWWPADVHVVGKDITRFHCVIWPAMLMAAGLPLPRTVFGHGFIYHSGEKMSKSLGNIVNPLEVVARTGPDALRYFLLREISFGKDGDFTWDGFITRTNADLANDLGNLLKRTTEMTLKFLDGRIAAGRDAGPDRTGLAAVAAVAARDVEAAYRDLDPTAALEAAWQLVRAANRAVQETKPWELAKDPARADELAGVLSEILEAIRIAGELLEPAIPRKARRLRERLGLPGDPAPWREACAWRDRPAWVVRPGEPLFPRLDRAAAESAPPPETAAATPAAAKAAKAAKDGAGGGALTIDRFRETELLVATIETAERVEGADRLLRLSLDLGREKRQVVAGIAAHYAPETLPGRQVVIVANLEPAVIRGVESRGMILAAKAGEKLTLLAPGDAIAPGAKVS